MISLDSIWLGCINYERQHYMYKIRPILGHSEISYLCSSVRLDHLSSLSIVRGFVWKVQVLGSACTATHSRQMNSNLTIRVSLWRWEAGEEGNEGLFCCCYYWTSEIAMDKVKRHFLYREGNSSEFGRNVLKKRQKTGSSQFLWGKK